MVDRRSFIASTIGIAAALAAGNEAEGRSGASTPADAARSPTEPAIALVDRSLAGSAAFAAAARARGLRALEFTGDVAAVWMSELEPRLRSGPIAIAGYTSAATWFCVDLLARDFGALTLKRSEENEAISFLISQTPGRPAALAPAAVRAQWSLRHA